MRSKTSFFNRTIFMKNILRFWPMWILYLAVLFFSLPVSLYLRTNPQRLHAANLAEAQLREVVTCVNWGTTANFVYIFVMAIVLVLLIFSYLYSARSCNMMHALPVSRKELFVTGYLNALLKAGIGVDDRKVLWIDTEDQKNIRNIRASLLRRLMDCTAVFCYNDQVAFELIELLQKEGIRVPGQLSVISIDGTELSLLCEPKITSIPHPMEELGQKAAEYMVRMIVEPGFQEDYLYCPEVLERSSIKRIGG